MFQYFLQVPLQQPGGVLLQHLRQPPPPHLYPVRHWGPGPQPGQGQPGQTDRGIPEHDRLPAERFNNSIINNNKNVKYNKENNSRIEQQ